MFAEVAAPRTADASKIPGLIPTLPTGLTASCTSCPQVLHTGARADHADSDAGPKVARPLLRRYELSGLAARNRAGRTSAEEAIAPAMAGTDARRAGEHGAAGVVDVLVQGVRGQCVLAPAAFPATVRVQCGRPAPGQLIV
jgi:hypothetical protein